jgi:hypothetical protein
VAENTNLSFMAEFYGRNLPPGTVLSPFVRIASTFKASGFKASGFFPSRMASPIGSVACVETTAQGCARSDRDLVSDQNGGFSFEKTFRKQW